MAGLFFVKEASWYAWGMFSPAFSAVPVHAGSGRKARRRAMRLQSNPCYCVEGFVHPTFGWVCTKHHCYTPGGGSIEREDWNIEYPSLPSPAPPQQPQAQVQAQGMPAYQPGLGVPGVTQGGSKIKACSEYAQEQCSKDFQTGSQKWVTCAKTAIMGCIRQYGPGSGGAPSGPGIAVPQTPVLPSRAVAQAVPVHAGSGRKARRKAARAAVAQQVAPRALQASSATTRNPGRVTAASVIPASIPSRCKPGTFPCGPHGICCPAGSCREHNGHWGCTGPITSKPPSAQPKGISLRRHNTPDAITETFKRPQKIDKKKRRRYKRRSPNTSIVTEAKELHARAHQKLGIPMLYQSRLPNRTYRCDYNPAGIKVCEWIPGPDKCPAGQHPCGSVDYGKYICCDNAGRPMGGVVASAPPTPKQPRGLSLAPGRPRKKAKPKIQSFPVPSGPKIQTFPTGPQITPGVIPPGPTLYHGTSP